MNKHKKPWNKIIAKGTGIGLFFALPASMIYFMLYTSISQIALSDLIHHPLAMIIGATTSFLVSVAGGISIANENYNNAQAVLEQPKEFLQSKTPQSVLPLQQNATKTKRTHTTQTQQNKGVAAKQVLQTKNSAQESTPEITLTKEK